MKKRIIYIILMALFIVYLFLADDVVLFIYGNRFSLINKDLASLANRKVSGAIDFEKCSEDQSILERVLFAGWAFFTDNTPNEKYQAGIALQNEKGEVYAYDAIPNYQRSDLNWMTGDRGIHGFEYTISTVSLPSDTYSIHIYCVDEKGNRGIAPTKYILEKNGRTVSLKTFQSRIKEIKKQDVLSVASDAKANIETINRNEDGTVIIGGWAYVPEQDAAKQKVNILLIYADGTSTVFDSSQIGRPDVAEVYNNELYTMSGFMAEIPKELLHLQFFDVYVLVRDDHGLHTSPEMLEAVQLGLCTQND